MLLLERICDGLKMLQLGLLSARHIPGDEQRAVVVGEIGRAAVEAVARELRSATPTGFYGAVDRPAARARLFQLGPRPREARTTGGRAGPRPDGLADRLGTGVTSPFPAARRTSHTRRRAASRSLHPTLYGDG
ncbi:MAG: hypothetical protein ACRDRW_03705 [Pseudonocardiaceae bacterium]